MEKRVKRVKRPRVHWNEVRLQLEDSRVDLVFFRLLQKHPKMSKDRIAWNALKHYYSTTTLARYRWLGVPLNEL